MCLIWTGQWTMTFQPLAAKRTVSPESLGKNRPQLRLTQNTRSCWTKSCFARTEACRAQALLTLNTFLALHKKKGTTIKILILLKRFVKGLVCFRGRPGLTHTRLFLSSGAVVGSLRFHRQASMTGGGAGSLGCGN